MTPLHILIAIHYHCHPYPYAEDEPEHRYSEMTRRYTEQLVAAGLLVPREPDGEDVPEDRRNTAEYEPTQGCHMYVDALCTIPLPKRGAAWMHPMVDTRAA